MLLELALSLQLCDCPPPPNPDNTWKYFTHAAVGSGFDLYGTAIAVKNGAVEGNPALQTVEHRVGAKLIYVGLHGAAFVILDKHLKKPKLALWGSRILGGWFVAIGLRNAFLDTSK
jgi:hypothetical protein